MAIIDQYRDLLTIVIEYKIDEQESVQKIIEYYKDFVKSRPGFISFNLHKTLDGEKLVNYMQWKSNEKFEEYRKARLEKHPCLVLMEREAVMKIESSS
jgi:heme-degrading monooxygenase HmoA